MILSCFIYRFVQKIFSASKLFEIVKMSTSDFPKSSKDSSDENDELDPERVRLQNNLLYCIYIL